MGRFNSTLYFTAYSDGTRLGLTLIKKMLVKPILGYTKQDKLELRPNMYSVIKTLHILSATILFGTGLGIAFFMFMAQRQSNINVRVFAAKLTVKADSYFTFPAAIAQPLTGAYLLYLSGLPAFSPWLSLSYALYIIAGACWIPVVLIQISIRNQLIHSLEHNLPPNERYSRLIRWWFWLGWPAFLSFIGIFYLMVAKPYF